MKLLRKTGFLLVALLLLGAGFAQAAPQPEWVRKGESFMNRKRTNTSYSFKIFKSVDSFLSLAKENRFIPLLEYLGGQYGADPLTMTIDSLSNGPGEPSTYRIDIPVEGRTETAWAQRLDDYYTFDYIPSPDPVYEYFQLYAVSEKGVEPSFDTFRRTDREEGNAALMSFLPGAGQLYKGKTVEGYAIMGTEIALGAVALIQQIRAGYYDRMAQTATTGTDSFRNDAIGVRKIRNVALVGMGALWTYSIIDALVSVSVPRISVSAPQGALLTISPTAASAGLAFVYRF